MVTESFSTAAGTSLYSQYPITSSWELTLHGGEVVKGQVYCTDPIASIVVLQDPALNDIRMVSVGAIQESKRIQEGTTTKSPVDLTAEISHTKKVLEEREKRAIKLAQESLKHLNPKASPKGQMVFDRLLKACNEVVWKNESIIVLHTIQVDPPYEQENCKLLKGGSAQQGSLDRVQKIVAAASSVK